MINENQMNRMIHNMQVAQKYNAYCGRLDDIWYQRTTLIN